MIDRCMEVLSSILASGSGAPPLIAFAAGVLSSLAPCVLLTLPLVMGYVLGGVKGGSVKSSFKLSLAFAGGTAVSFIILFAAASALEKTIAISGRWLNITLGVLLLIMAFRAWEYLSIIPSWHVSPKNTKRGYAGAAAVGALAGVFSSPYAVYDLTSLLAYGKDIFGVVLLFALYSLGYSILAVACGTLAGLVKRVTQSNRHAVYSRLLRFITGLLILITAAYILYLGFK